MHHDCHLMQEKLIDLLFDEADETRNKHLLSEFEDCRECRMQYDSMKETLSVFDRAVEIASPHESYWASYQERLHAMLLQETQTLPVNPFAFAVKGGREEYHLTMLEDAGLSHRLSSELRAVAHQSQLTWPEFKRDPKAF
ncbi:MAG TPA: hypothetical protein VF666_08355, partial [Pyrinomonadaceae bacterium]